MIPKLLKQAARIAPLFALSLISISGRAQQQRPMGRVVYIPTGTANVYDASVGDIPAITDFVEVSGGSHHGVGIRSDGSLKSWGDDQYGVVSQTPAGNDFKSVSAGYEWSVALKTDGTLVTWGFDLATIDQTYYPGPVFPALPTGQRFVSVAAGALHGVALADDGTIHSWGWDGYGSISNTPTESGFVSVAAGPYSSVAFREDGTLVQWGYAHGAPPAGLKVLSVSPGYYGNTAVLQDGSLFSWGDLTRFPLSVPAGNDFSAASVASQSAIALRNDGSIVGWNAQFTPPYDARIPSGYDFFALANTLTDAHLALRPENHAPRNPDLGPDVVFGATHSGSPSHFLHIAIATKVNNLDPDNDSILLEFFRDDVLMYSLHFRPWEFWGDTIGWSEQFDTRTPDAHTYRMTVTDPFGASSSAEKVVTVLAEPNQTPIANAGPDVTYYLPHDGDPTTNVYGTTTSPFSGLDGSASTDPDGDRVTYNWFDEFGNLVSFSRTTGGTPRKVGLFSFDGPDGNFISGLTVGDHTYTLVVTDTYGATSTDSVTLHVVEPNQAPVMNAVSPVAVNDGCQVTVQATASDPDGAMDVLTFSKASGPSWATVSASGAVTLNTPAGTVGTFTVAVKVTDPYGASDQKNVAVTVCPIAIEGVTLTRKNTDITVQFNVRNTDGTIVNTVSINSSTLKGSATKSAMPIVFTQLKQGVVKTVQLKFSGIASGPAQFIVNGTSSAGPVNANLTVNVP